VELGLTQDPRWLIDDLGRYLDAVTSAGFTSVGLTQAVAAPMPDGVSCPELLLLTIRRDEAATLALAEELARAAAIVGATWVLTMMTTSVRPESIDLLGRCADVIAPSGARIALEFGPSGPVCTIPGAVDVVTQVGPGSGVLVDTWHFCHGPSTFEDLETMPLDKLAYVQFDDAPEWQTSGVESGDVLHETTNRRLWPGEGILPLDRFTRTLRGRGWDGLVTVEVLNAEYADLPTAEFARLAFASTATFWT
jgi:sugar phosphate isomerase/epimerase